MVCHCGGARAFFGYFDNYHDEIRSILIHSQFMRRILYGGRCYRWLAKDFMRSAVTSPLLPPFENRWDHSRNSQFDSDIVAECSERHGANDDSAQCELIRADEFGIRPASRRHTAVASRRTVVAVGVAIVGPKRRE